MTAFGGARGGGSHLFTDLFSPSDFKIKNFKKEFKKKKKNKDFRRKETYFQNADALLQSSGIGQCSPATAVDWRLSPRPVPRPAVTVLHMRKRSQESQGSRGAAPHRLMYFVTQLLALKMLLKNKQKNKEKKKKEEKNTKKKNT